MERGQNIHMNRVWKKWISAVVDDSEGFKTSVEEVTADMVRTAGELQLEGEPEAVIELLHLRIKLDLRK